MDRKRKSGSDMGELPAELQHDGPKCTCAYAHKPENADTGSGDSEGGAARDLVGQEHNGNRRAADSRIRNDSGKVRQHHRHPHRLDRNRGDELREAGVEVVSHRYYGVSPRPSLEHIAEERVKTNFDNKVTHKVSTSGDVLFPFISRNPLFAKLVPVFASAPNSETQAGGSLDDNMELVIGTRKHKSSGSHKHHGEGSPKKHHHHRHRSEGDIEKDRVRPKSKRDEDELRESKDKVELAGRSRSDDRGKEKSVLSSSSSREKEKPIPSSSSSREREKPIASSSSSREKEKHRSKSPTSTERARHGESDKQREERRRKKKERSQEDKDKHSVGDKQKERPQDAASFAAGLASLDAKDKKKENKSKRRYRESVADTTLADVLVIRGGGESPGLVYPNSAVSG